MKEFGKRNLEPVAVGVNGVKKEAKYTIKI